MNFTPSFLNKRSRVATVTIEEDAIRMVEVKSTSPLHVVCAEERSLPSGVVTDGKIVDADTLMSILGEAVEEWKLSRKSVRFLAPDEYVIIRKLSYPPDVRRDELKGHFFIEIGSTLYLPFEDPVFDVVPYTASTDTKEAILIASKESILNTYEDVFEEVKMKPIVADIGPLALYRLAYSQYAYTGEEHILLLDIKNDNYTVSIFHQHFPLFMRPVEVAEPDESNFFSGAQTSKMDSLISEIEKLINFYRYNMNQGNEGITHILLNGEMDGWEELLRKMENRFDVMTSTVVRETIYLEDGKAIPIRFNRALGLALKEV
ncbi:pilus assembly protein PilM [Paenisporosarcina quisquiliarum]|uniref:Pilus assembly protein PilM n=1 Tax=Paenisporosarcina quisquiliarum TaxID=365346 RepID=A0A9X3RCH3_9BACL|nr:pilus assembly protein PilM [Paenisporosarcina quisquiliarum]MCZ8536174.1 pilus assembly protein PilM [Paenisporosarcina quisquiliarum]